MRTFWIVERMRDGHIVPGILTILEEATGWNIGRAVADRIEAKIVADSQGGEFRVGLGRVMDELSRELERSAYGSRRTRDKGT